MLILQSLVMTFVCHTVGIPYGVLWVLILLNFSNKIVCMRALKGLVPPRASHSDAIALAGSRRLRSTLAAAPVLFAHAVVTEIKIGRIISPTLIYAM